MTPDDQLVSARFPRSSKYNLEWIVAGVSGGANALWLAEWLAEVVDLRPGMRVLDLGCGRASSSIFLRREFGVQVWATDLWFGASANWERVRDAGVEDGVFPIHADARSLPFASEFFDAVVSIDSFFYYGTDDLYLSNLARFLKPGGVVAIAGAGLVQEFDGPIPEHLREWWTQDLWCLHSAAWWRRHWDRNRGCGAGRFHARRLEVLARLAPDDRPRQPGGDRCAGGRSRARPHLRASRRPSPGGRRAAGPDRLHPLAICEEAAAPRQGVMLGARRLGLAGVEAAFRDQGRLRAPSVDAGTRRKLPELLHPP